ncbi:MAG: mevalonate kinase [Deltaproteobacteria bacterium]|nr:mevalonate kinase [Deltaproteobacteria bacterium]
MSADAHAKAILTGEHFVIWGGTALAIPLRSTRLEVTLAARPAVRNRFRVQGDDPDRAMLQAARIGARALRTPVRHDVAVSVSADFPPCSGLGYSAAFSVAFCRALATLGRVGNPEDRVAQAALDMEKVFHDRPSGIDSTTIAFDAPCFVKTGRSFSVRNGDHKEVHGPMAGFLDVAGGGVFLLADSGERASTREVISRVLALLERPRGELVLQRLTAVSESISLQTATALKKGDWEFVGNMLDENQCLLTGLGVSTQRLDSLCRAAVRGGAYGAKLTGSGLGGYVLAATTADRLTAVKKALGKEGVTHFIVQETGDFVE